MCQMNIILEKDAHQEPLLEGASLLEVTPDGIRISTLFDEPKTLTGVVVKRIDFLDGVVTLTKS